MPSGRRPPRLPAASPAATAPSLRSSTSALRRDGWEFHGVAVFQDLTGPGAATRTAAALVQTAAQLVGTATTSEILAEIARRAVEGTRAVACGIDVVGDDHKLTSAGGYGFPFYLSEEGRPGIKSRAARGGGPDQPG